MNLRKLKAVKDRMKKWIISKIIKRIDVESILTFLINEKVFTTDEINNMKYCLNNRLYFVELNYQDMSKKPEPFTLTIKRKPRKTK